MNVHGNTILITGGNSGIGRALAERFAALGNAVVIAGRRQEALDEVTSANPGMTSLTVDMSDAASIADLARRATERFPDLDAVFNVAGMMVPEDVRHQDAGLDVATKTVATNLLGPIRLTAALLPSFLARDRATIVNVSSGLAFVPMAMTATYCATKAAIHSYTQSLRYQLRDSKVEVLELVPPYVATTLMGPDMAKDPMAMPLDAFIDETMRLLQAEPTAPEILVENVLPLRYAAENENRAAYDGFFNHFNDMVSERASR